MQPFNRRTALRLAAGLVAAGAAPTAATSAHAAPEPTEPPEPMEATGFLCLWPTGFGGPHFNAEVAFVVDGRGRGAVEVRRRYFAPGTVEPPIAAMEAPAADVLRELVALLAAA